MEGRLEYNTPTTVEEEQTPNEPQAGEGREVLLVALHNLDEASYEMHSRDPLTRQIAAVALALIASLLGFSGDDFQPLPP